MHGAHAAHEHGLGCGRRSLEASYAGREPFCPPGTEVRYAPDRAVDVLHTRLELKVDPAVVRIEGTARHTVTALGPEVSRLLLHARELTIDSVQGPSGKPLAFRHEGERLEIELGRVLPPGEETTVSVAYHGAPRRGLHFIRPDAAYPDKPLQVWSQGQDEDSRSWFPCFDHPIEKASTEILARVPSRLKALSNGALVGRTEHGDGTATWHWKQAVPHSAYLVTLVVGEFEEVELRGGRVPLTAWVPPGSGEQARRAFGRTPAMLDHFEERFGVPFPWEKYAQVVVADFVFGGMENTSATTLIETALYDDRAALDYDADDLVAHELAHQWWGDLLTCRDWSHAWLNEGFATWSELVFREHHLGQDEADYARRGMAEEYFEEDAGAYRRAIVDARYDDPIALFDRHLYEKGALVVHMLRRELGEDAFWRAIRTYAMENRGRAVVTEDLRRAVETATGRNLEWFFDQWIHRGGHPELSVSHRFDPKTGVLSVTVKQTQAGDAVTPEVFRFTADVEVVTGGRGTRHRLEVTRREHTFHLPVNRAPDAVRFDPEGHVLAVVELDDTPDLHRRTLEKDPDVLARARAATALAKDLTPDTVAALAKALDDKFWGVAAEAARALGRHRTPAARAALVGGLKTVKHPKARRAVARSLGVFRHDPEAAAALSHVLEKGDASLFVEAAAAEALGQTRVEGARAALEQALRTKDSWAETIRAGCVRGLALLADPEVIPAIEERSRRGHLPRLRMASLGALAELGRRLATKDAVREILEDALLDGDFRVQMAAIGAMAALEDARGTAALARLQEAAPDGRIRRSARGAGARLRRVGERSQEAARLGDDVETLRKRNADLLSRLERVEARLGPAALTKTPAKKTPAKRKAPAKKKAAPKGRKRTR